MYIYHSFVSSQPADLDQWLNSFRKDLPFAEYNVEVVGFAPINKGLQVLCTIRVFESKPSL